MKQNLGQAAIWLLIIAFVAGWIAIAVTGHGDSNGNHSPRVVPGNHHPAEPPEEPAKPGGGKRGK
jgi:hypothetical protein